MLTLPSRAFEFFGKNFCAAAALQTKIKSSRNTAPNKIQNKQPHQRQLRFFQTSSRLLNPTMATENYSRKVDNVVEVDVRPLADLATVIQNGLSKNFATSQCEVTDCPDLTKLGLAFGHFGSRAHVADVGGPGHLYPELRKDRLYDVAEVAAACDMPKASLIIGPGAGPWPSVGCNCEMMCNCSLHGGNASVKTEVSFCEGEGYKQQQITNSTQFALMANFLLTDGDAGKVLHVKAAKRTGAKNLTDCIRLALAEKYGESIVSVGGVFLMAEGKANIHVMPDFPAENLKSAAEVGKWLKFFTMKAPLTCLSVMHSCDPGYDLRTEHTHVFSPHGDGGHYHYDTTPEEVVYEGWFVPASKVYRIDRVAEQGSMDNK